MLARMSAEENARAVQAVFEAVGRGDVAYILDQLVDDVHWVAHLDPRLRDGKIVGYDLFNDAGLTAAFASPGCIRRAIVPST